MSFVQFDDHDGQPVWSELLIGFGHAIVVAGTPSDVARAVSGLICHCRPV